MKRREFLLRAGTGVAATLVAPRVAARTLGTTHGAGTPLRLPTSWDGSPIVARAVDQQIWPGQSTRLMTFGGSWPGPLIRMRRGQRFEARIVNELDQETTMHWHGLIVPHDMDGHPTDAIAPGTSRDIAFDVLNRAGTFWYHPHPHGHTASQTYRGLGGIIVIEDDDEQALTLPRGAYDLPLLIQDRDLRGGRSLEYAPTSAQRLNGLLGDTVFVNGTPDATHTVDAGKYRLRLINGSNARILKLAFSDARAFSVIASDGGLLEAPRAATDVMLGPAERAEIVVDFADLAAGQSLAMRSIHFGTATSPDQQGFALDVITFVGSGAAGYRDPLPAALVEVPRDEVAAAERMQTFILDTSPIPIGGHHHKINGLVFDMHRVDARIERDALELWEIRNDHSMPHPIHIHGTQFQIVDRDQSTDLPPHEAGWKDTVLIAGETVVRVLVRFVYPGIYLLHCHNLEHEDDGMMINFAVDNESAAPLDGALPTTLDLR